MKVHKLILKSIIVIAIALTLQQCASRYRGIPESSSMGSLIGMSPFMPHKGGYKPGNIIGVNKINGYAEIAIGRVFLIEKGVDLTLSDVEKLSKYSIDLTDKFKTHISGKYGMGNFQASADFLVKHIKSVKFTIQEGERQILSAGYAAVYEWLSKLDPNKDQDYITIGLLLSEKTENVGRKKRLIVEVISANSGKYEYDFSDSISSKLKTEFSKVFNVVGDLSWEGAKKVNILIEHPVLLGYDYYNIPLFKIGGKMRRYIKKHNKKEIDPKYFDEQIEQQQSQE